MHRVPGLFTTQASVPHVVLERKWDGPAKYRMGTFGARIKSMLKCSGLPWPSYDVQSGGVS